MWLILATHILGLRFFDRTNWNQITFTVRTRSILSRWVCFCNSFPVSKTSYVLKDKISRRNGPLEYDLLFIKQKLRPMLITTEAWQSCRSWKKSLKLQYIDARHSLTNCLEKLIHIMEGFWPGFAQQIIYSFYKVWFKGNWYLVNHYMSAL